MELKFTDALGHDLSSAAHVFSLPLSFPCPGDGHYLRCAFWHGSNRDCGTFCLLQGRTEFIEHYYGMIRYLLGLGYSVAVFDWCGQGGSSRFLDDGVKGHIDDFCFYDTSLDVFMSRIISELPGPFYGFGHSMGGLILLRSVLRSKDYFSRIILSSPMLSLGSCRSDWGFVRILVRFLRFLGFGKFYVPFGRSHAGVFSPFRGNLYTGDRDRLEILRDLARHLNDFVIGSPTIAWLDSAFYAMDDFMASVFRIGSFEHGLMSSFSPRLCIIFGSSDRVISVKSYDLLRSFFPSLSVFEIDCGRHVLLYERDEIIVEFWDIFARFMHMDSTPIDIDAK